MPSPSQPPPRPCGGCGACCEIPAIDAPGLVKPRGVLCPNCTLGTGCGIYERRPDVCRDFSCFWQSYEVLPLDARPDRLGVMFSLEPNPLRDRPGTVCAVARALGDGTAFFAPAVLRAIVLILRRRIDVHLSWGRTKTLVLPVADAAGRLWALDMPVDEAGRRRRVPLPP